MIMDSIHALCECAGTSGCEDEVRAYIRKHAETYADEIREDNIGNLMVFKKGRKSDKTLMLSAHMDEVGVICRGYTDDGCVKFGFVGGVDIRNVIGRRIMFEGGVLGVIGIKAVHLTTKSERQTMPKAKDLYVDIGCDSKDSAKGRVPLGNYGVFHSGCVEFGDGLLKGKAIDGRTGCAVLLELIKEPVETDTWFVFTAQEEVGLRGARCAAFDIKPDLCLVVDGCNAADLADVEKHNWVCSLRGGAVIPFMDKGAIYDSEICQILKQSAQKSGVKWQAKQSTAGQTDAGRIHLTREGIRTGVIAVPVRYNHSPACVAAKEDINAVLATVREFLKAMGE